MFQRTYYQMRCGKGILSSGGVNALQRTHWRRGLDTVFPPSTVVLLTMCKSIAEDFAISTKRVEMPVFLNTSEMFESSFAMTPRSRGQPYPSEWDGCKKWVVPIFILEAISLKLH